MRKTTIILTFLIISFICVLPIETNATPSASDLLPTAECEQISISEYAFRPCFPATIGNTPTDTSATAFAYKQFYAVNWPSDSKLVGIPNFNQDYSTSIDHFPVWQTWPTLQDLQVSQNKKVSLSWGSLDYFIPKQCEALVTRNKNGISPLSSFIEKHPSIPMGAKVEVLFDIKDARNDVLFDRNKNPVFYQIYLNKQSWTYLSEQPSKPYSFQIGTLDNLQRGAMFLKAAWMILDKEQVLDFHSSIALVFNSKTKDCSLKLVGLAGLHIVNKSVPSNYTKINNQRTNEWSWSTHEHINNAPTPDELSTPSTMKHPWNLFNLDLSDSKTLASLKKSCMKNKTWDFSNSKCVINEPNINPSQIVNILTLPREIKEQNALYNSNAKKQLAKSGSKFVNYSLSASQWLKDKQMSPANLSNTTMESFFQEKNCAGCHSSASTQDFMFLNSKKLKTLPDWIKMSGDTKLFN